MRAYKVFNPDFTCHGQKFEVGGRYTEYKDSGTGETVTDKSIELCRKGFHACIKPNKCFSYYDFNSSNIVCEVELHGDIKGDENDKICTNDIEILRQLTWDEVLKIVNTGVDNTGLGNTGDQNTGNRNTGNQNTGNQNTGNRNTGDQNTGNRNTGDHNTGNRNTGDWNTGDWNTGNRNTGDQNTGNRNTGNRNTGNWNTGDWNTGDWNTGFLNTTEPKVRIFNKTTNIKRENINFPNYFSFDTKIWVWLSQMMKEEIEANPSAKTCDGYLKTIKYKEAWKVAFENASNNEIEQTKQLPNFDAQLFFEITGIDYFLNH